MRRQPPTGAAPIIRAAILFALLTLASALMPGAGALSVMSRWYDLDVAATGWPVVDTYKAPGPVGDDLAHLLDGW